MHLYKMSSGTFFTLSNLLRPTQMYYMNKEGKIQLVVVDMNKLCFRDISEETLRQIRAQANFIQVVSLHSP